MTRFIKACMQFFKDFNEYVKSGNNNRKRFDALIVKTNELTKKHDELIRHMTQFFLTSQKIQLEDYKKKKEEDEFKNSSPDDMRF